MQANDEALANSFYMRKNRKHHRHLPSLFIGFVLLAFPPLLHSQATEIKAVDSLVATCDTGVKFDDLYKVRTRIIAKTNAWDTLHIQLGTVDNCIMSDAVGGYRYRNDTLALYYAPKDVNSALDCNCCFRLDFTIENLALKPATTVLLNNKPVQQHPKKFLTAEELSKKQE
ncbi:MAG: hypothetical protein AAGB22_03820 [Bacteroidota bacterium]